MPNLRLSSRSIRTRQLVILLIALLSIFILFTPYLGVESAQLPYPFYLFTNAQPSTLLLLTLVILLIMLVGRSKEPERHDPSRRGAGRDVLPDGSEKPQ